MSSLKEGKYAFKGRSFDNCYLRTGHAMLLSAGPAAAQQTTGTPGSPGATTTISGKQLPPPDPPFGGVIKDDALQSKYWWAPRHRASQSRAQHPADYHG